MRRASTALLLCALMALLPLAGCLTGADGPEGPEGPQGDPGIDGMDGVDGANGSTLHLVANATELPDCAAALHGQIYFVAGDGAFQVCSTAGWGAVDLTGPPGDDGADGTDGSNGMDGADGADGQAAMAMTLPEPVGEACINGGVRIEVGVDDNGDGTLTPDEVDQITHVCNGMDGQDGSASEETMLTMLSAPDLSMGCDAGGRVMAQGLDNGDGNGVARNGILEADEVDARTVFCSQLSFDRLTDISSGSNHSYPGFYMEVRVGNTLYFDSDDGTHGRELWAYGLENGTTWMVADINPGAAWSYPGYFRETVIGDSIYFGATTPTYGFEMWFHNTVTGETQRVTDINPGAGGSNFGEDMQIAVGDLLYFSAFDPVTYTELWVYDTVSGTLHQV
ncbi:MAG: DUF7151 family protein, partial [Candidatus Poseidoniaceae archaeon]